MLFNSYTFIFLYLPLTFAGFHLASRSSRRLAVAWLVFASLAFYGFWNPRFVLLLLGSIACNFLFGLALERFRGRYAGAVLLAVFIGADLSLLFIFKYADFFMETVIGLSGNRWHPINFVLPLGISFFTFTQITFLVDVYRNQAHESHFLEYALFVTYFPHLIAGPILHHSQIIPQLYNSSTFRLRADWIAAGLALFILGLAKKVLLADNFGEYAQPIFDAARDGIKPQLLSAWTGTFAYTLQLYFDFSGYSDMAVGMSLLFGIKLPFNFDSPYKAHNIIDFWRRWHMTLSRFLRDYLYIPLGGNRVGSLHRYFNVMVTMLLGGLWHGANWTFIAWGGIHGLLLGVNQAWERQSTGDRNRHSSTYASDRLCVGITFLLVALSWVVFRAANLQALGAMFGGMLGFHGVSMPHLAGDLIGSEAARLLSSELGIHFEGAYVEITALSGMSPAIFALLFLIGMVIVWGLPNSQQWVGLVEGVNENRSTVISAPAWKPQPWAGVLLGVLLAMTVLSLTRVSTFLYYQF